MKKILIAAAFYFLTVFYGSYSQSPNIQPLNLDFEEGQPGAMPSGWYMPNYATKQKYSGFLTEENPKRGKYCLELRHDGEYIDTIYGAVVQSVDATPYRGKKIRFRAAARAELRGRLSTAHIWTRTHLENNQDGFLNILEDSTIISNEWKYYEIVSDVEEFANVINFGLLLKGTGRVWIDDASLEIIMPEGQQNEPPKDLNNRELENLFAFTKLMGYVKYFYPGEEAQSLFWDKFTMAGMQAVEKSDTPESLAKILNKLFLPIAPALKIYTGTSPISKGDDLIPGNAIKNAAYCMEHIGLKTGKDLTLFSSSPVNIYKSPRPVEGTVYQTINTNNIKGKRVRFSADIKADIIPPSGQAQLWLRIDNDDGSLLKYANMDNNPAIVNSWKNYSIEVDVPADCKLLKVAFVLIGDGKAWFDNAKLSIVENENPVKVIELKNPDLEEGDLGKVSRGWLLFTSSETAGYNAVITEDKPSNGKRCLLISTEEKSTVKFPTAGEKFSKSLGAGVSFSMPLTLLVDSIHTLPYPTAKFDSSLLKKPYGFVVNANDRISRLMITANCWAFFRQFGILNNNGDTWDQALNESLRKASIDKNENEFTATLEKLSEKLNDNQARIWNNIQPSLLYGPPFLLDRIGGKLLVTQVYPDFQRIHAGDEIVSIDGVKSSRYLDSISNYISGSPDWKNLRAVAQLRSGEQNSHIQLDIVSPNGKKFSDTYSRDMLINELGEKRPQEITQVAAGIVYVDLTRVNDNSMKPVLSKLQDAKGLIFDLRGNPAVAEHFLGIFLSNPVPFVEWRVPVFTKPDQELISWKVINSVIKPINKHVTAKTVFLIDERTSGFGEALAITIEKYKIGTLIGRSTAGCASEVFAVRFTGDYLCSMTGMLSCDYSGNLNCGSPIQPDMLVVPTKQDFAKGIDPILEKAKEYLKKELSDK